MGQANSREGLDLSDSDEYDDRQDSDTSQDSPTPTTTTKPSPLNDVESRLQALKLKYSTPSPRNNFDKNAVKLYRHFGGDAFDSKWKLADAFVTFSFVRSNEDEEGEGEEGLGYWVLEIGSKIRVRVSTDLQLKMFPEQIRVDFVCNGVWALKFSEKSNYDLFVSEFEDCLFENVHGLKPTEENKLKVFGKDFLAWLNPEVADDTMWDAVDDGGGEEQIKTPGSGGGSSVSRLNHDLIEEFEEEVANNGIQSLALGALDNSFLVGNEGIQVVKNFRHGIHGKGVCVKFDRGGSNKANVGSSYSTPKKAILMRGETNMMLMSPVMENKPHAQGLHQLDIETGKIVTEWKFEKDGADISMRDIANDNKGAQLDPSGSTFLGLDDNRLCQWDMRDRRGMVQNIASVNASPVLHWNQGHQFSRGSNFQCFASTGDGSIVVGSLDGKIRLYSKTSMRQAKTVFPGLGSPITHVDVTYDGKWVLGTTDTYLILICTLFTDKDGRTKTGFGGRMGNRVSAPRLLKLTPVDAHLAGANNKFHGGQFSWVRLTGITLSNFVS